MAIDDVSGGEVNIIDMEMAQQFRATSMLAAGIPVAMMDPIGMEFIVLSPRERATLPAGEGKAHSLESRAMVQGRKYKFHTLIGWRGARENIVREVSCPVEDQAIVVVIHRFLGSPRAR